MTHRTCLTMVGALLVACGNTSQPEDVELEVYTWWEAASEVAAFNDLTQQFKAGAPGRRVKPVLRSDSSKVRGDLSGLLIVGSPPNSFQANAGADLLQWVATDFQGAGGQGGASITQEDPLLEALDPEVFRLEEMYSVVSDKVCAEVKGARQHFGVPVNVHRLNLLYYNAKQASEENFTLDTLCSDSPPAIALANTTFPVMLLAFENLMLARTDAQFYGDFFRGEPGPGWRERVAPALDCLWQLSQNKVEVGSWDEAVKKVADGDADFVVMGDWATPEFALLKPEGSEGEGAFELGVIPFPETESVFVFTSDTFPLPVGARLSSQSLKLLRSFATVETQLRFSKAKGSIPALDLKPDEVVGLGDFALRSFDDFTNRNIAKVLASSGWFPSYVDQERIEDALEAVTTASQEDAPGRIESVLDLLESSLPLFRKWQDRVPSCE